MIVYLLILGGLLFLTGGALFFFHWAARDGQFSDLERGARVIFDESEPCGRRTDAFPGERGTDLTRG